MRIFACGVALLAALVPCALPAAAQAFEGAQAKVDQRLDQALRELAEVRDRIAQEKIPLSRAVAKLGDEVLALRQEQARLLQIRDSRTLDLTSLRKQVESLAEQERFVNSRLNEFVRDFEARLDISELPRYEDLTAAAKLADKNESLDAADRRGVQIRVVAAAFERLAESLGGRLFAGEALGPDGLLREGTFVAFGPAVYFASTDGDVVGLVEHQLNAADPVVVVLPDRLGRGVAALAKEARGALPLDPTLGKALKQEKARKTLGQYVADGGMVGYVIIALGAAALLLSLFKVYEIVGFVVAGPGEVDAVLGELVKGNREAAIWQAQRVEGVVGEMLATGVEHAGEKRGVLEELLFEKILRVRPALERHLPFLAISAAAAPLLGLLGTVIGMIKTFQLITVFGTGDAKSLSSGISEALITTALGLMVAIPALILHGTLSRMAKRKLGLLEEIQAAFVNGVAAVRRSRPDTAAGS